MKEIGLVAVGGALGSVMRYLMGVLIAWLGLPAVWSTFGVNILGSFLIGIVMGLASGTPWFLFGALGVCGGFTTFSTFSAQVFGFFESGQYGLAILYALGSLILGVSFVFLGLLLAKAIHAA